MPGVFQIDLPARFLAGVRKCNMAIAKANHLPTQALYMIRPALVEAKLMTDKRARDAIYVVTLAEELRTIEKKITAMEEALQLVSQQGDARAQESACRRDAPDANWIRAKSNELDHRLHRIEQSAKSK